jgi:hypothetical protein
MHSNYIVSPSQQIAYSVIDINNAPTRVIDDHSVWNGLHDIFALTGVPSRRTCQAINAEEQAGILYSESGLLRELFQ